MPEASPDLQAISDKIDVLQEGLSGLVDDFAVVKDNANVPLDTSFDTVNLKLDTLNDSVISLSSAVDSANANSLDYTSTLEQIGQLLAVTDILVLILCVVVFLSIGTFAGYQITRWLKHD